MSAINPASFASPTLGIQAPSGVGPGAVGVVRAASSNDRRPNQQNQDSSQAAAFTTGARDGRGFRPTYSQPYGSDRGGSQPTGYPPSNYPYGQQFGAFGNPRVNPYLPGGGGGSGLESYLGQPLQQAGDSQSMRRFPNQQSGASPGPHSQGASSMSSQADWVGSFQGLSLNTH